MNQSSNPSVAAILTVNRRPQFGDGVEVRARYACGHQQTVYFPAHDKRISKAELYADTFPAYDGGGRAVCSRCQKAGA